MNDLAYLTDVGAGRGSDPSLLVDELGWYIRDAITNHPRSLQKTAGPSDLGHACPRRIGYTLLGVDDCNDQPDVPWLPTVGTSVHSWLEAVFTGPKTQGRFLTEQRVTVGQVAGVDVTGSCDLYDTVTATVVDWKCVGITTLRSARSKGPSDQYRRQIHLYGRGFAARGLPVDRVMIAYLPRNNELKDAYFWSEPYDEQVALDALQRAEGIALMTSALGTAALQHLPTADAFCSRCPWFEHGSTDPATGCPGDPARRVQPDAALSLIAP